MNFQTHSRMGRARNGWRKKKWEENDPKEMAWEYEDELETACEEGNGRK
ncbi:hypothetical protein AALB64_12415 [Lachnospiraceae bacterium 45-P1]